MLCLFVCVCAPLTLNNTIRLVNVPRVITDCVQYLRASSTALSEVGLFRQSGSESRLEEWQLYYDEGATPLFDEGTVHDVASLLKRESVCVFVAAQPLSCCVPTLLHDVKVSWVSFPAASFPTRCGLE
jgi:hypothetical protein